MIDTIWLLEYVDILRIDCTLSFVFYIALIGDNFLEVSA